MRLWLVLILLAFARVAHADGEGWFIVDTRLPVYEGHGHQVSLRLMTDFRVANRAHGLQQALGRFGFLWSPVPAVMVGAQLDGNMTTNDGKKYTRETRVETEATFTMPLSSWLELAHRERLEVRFSDTTVRLRHRLLFRANIMSSWTVFPFIWTETLLVANDNPLDQQRTAAGFVWRARRALAVEVGAFIRFRPMPGGRWETDAGPRIALSFQPLFDGAVQSAGTE